MDTKREMMPLSRHVWSLTRAAAMFTTVLLLLTAATMFSVICLDVTFSNAVPTSTRAKGDGFGFEYQPLNIKSSDRAMLASRRVLDGGNALSSKLAGHLSTSQWFVHSVHQTLTTTGQHLRRMTRVLQVMAPGAPSSAPPSVSSTSPPSGVPPSVPSESTPTANAANPPSSSPPPPPPLPLPPTPPSTASTPVTPPPTIPSSSSGSSPPLPATEISSSATPVPSQPSLPNPKNRSSKVNTTRPADYNDYTTAPGPDYGNFTANPTNYGQPRNDSAPSSSAPKPSAPLPYYYDPATGIALPITLAPRSAPPSSAPPSEFPNYPANSSSGSPSTNDDPDNTVPTNQTVYNAMWLNMTYPILSPEGRPIITVPPSMFDPVEKPNVSRPGRPRTKHPLTYLKQRQQPHFIVALDGSGDFTEIQEAINHVPWESESRYVILLKPGHYFERVWVPKRKPFITLIGWDRQTTIISFNLTADVQNSKGAPIKTYFSPSVIIEGRGFIARSITFRNGAPRPVMGSIISQAVAVRVTADQSAFYDCVFVGWQDTLYAHKGRQYYENCEIWGSVDFIFGNAAALFQNCSILVRGTGWLTAQSRKFPENRTGYIFYGGSITRAPDADVEIGSLLGRPWGYFSLVLFANMFIDNFVLGEGWGRWLGRELHSVYGEFNTTGPGSVAGNGTFRVPFSWNFSEAEVRPLLGEPGRRPGFDFIMADEWMEPLPNIPPPPPPSASDSMPSYLPEISTGAVLEAGNSSTSPPWTPGQSVPGGPPSPPSQPAQESSWGGGGTQPFAVESAPGSAPGSESGPDAAAAISGEGNISMSPPWTPDQSGTGSSPPPPPSQPAQQSSSGGGDQPFAAEIEPQSAPGSESGPDGGAGAGDGLSSEESLIPSSSGSDQDASAYVTGSVSSEMVPPSQPAQQSSLGGGGNQTFAEESEPQSAPGSESEPGAGDDLSSEESPTPSSTGSDQEEWDFMTGSLSSEVVPPSQPAQQSSSGGGGNQSFAAKSESQSAPGSESGPHAGAGAGDGLSSEESPIPSSTVSDQEESAFMTGSVSSEMVPPSQPAQQSSSGGAGNQPFAEVSKPQSESGPDGGPDAEDGLSSEDSAISSSTVIDEEPLAYMTGSVPSELMPMDVAYENAAGSTTGNGWGEGQRETGQ